MSIARVSRPRHAWSSVEDEKLIVAYEHGGMPAAYAAFPSLRAKQISGRVSWFRTCDKQRILTRERREEAKRIRIATPLPPSAPKKVMPPVPPLNSGDREYLRRRLEYVFAAISHERNVAIESVRVAVLDWAREISKPKPITIETETNAVDRAYGDAAVTVSFKFGSRG